MLGRLFELAVCRLQVLGIAAKKDVYLEVDDQAAVSAVAKTSTIAYYSYPVRAALGAANGSSDLPVTQVTRKGALAWKPIQVVPSIDRSEVEAAGAYRVVLQGAAEP